MMMHHHKNSSLRRRGYTLLFAALTATLVLGVAVFILSVSRKQFVLSAAARDSTYALYAADSGLECVLGNWNRSSTTPAFSCNGSSIPLAFSVVPTPSGFDASKPVYLADDIPVIFGSGNCTRLSIWVGYDEDDEGIERRVTVTRGYNLCDGSGNPQESPRTVERAIRFTF